MKGDELWYTESKHCYVHSLHSALHANRMQMQFQQPRSASMRSVLPWPFDKRGSPNQQCCQLQPPTKPSLHLRASGIFPQNRPSVSHIDEDVPQCQSDIRIVRLTMHAWQ
jgi:hypothetical protein